jgi:hypothetical protein
VFVVETAEEAFANAYLQIGLSENGKITEKSVEKDGDGFRVTLAFVEMQTVNF